MTDWTSLGRLRTFQGEIAHVGDLATVSIAGWGRGLNLTASEFAELLDHAELGKAVAAAADVLGRRTAKNNEG